MKNLQVGKLTSKRIKEPLQLQSLGDAMTDIVLTHGSVVTMNERREILRDGAVALDDNYISTVGKTTEIKVK